MFFGFLDNILEKPPLNARETIVIKCGISNKWKTKDLQD